MISDKRYIKYIKMSTVKGICLRCTGDVAEFVMKSVKIEDELSTEKIPKSVKRTKGIGCLKRRCDFPVNQKILALYAWDNGEAGDENKHELPPPVDNDLYFGNSYLLGVMNNNHVDVTKEDYNAMINEYFEGFDDIGSEDTWSEEESVASDDSIHDFIVEG
tara:strand:- start:23666 stop:24148 length:483 start_codon:yes stop_codon:yes gene_type:complete